MRKNKKENVLFQEMSFTGSDKIMILNKPKLLEMIEAVCKNGSLSSIRESIFKLKEHLSDRIRQMLRTQFHVCY